MPKNSQNNQEDQNKYQAARNDKKQAEQQSSKKAVDTAAKGAINAFTGGTGGAAFETAKKVPGVGKAIDKVEGKAANLVNKATGGAFGKVAKKADDAKILDAANKVMSMQAAQAANGAVDAADAAESVPKEGNNTGNDKEGLGKPSSLDNSNTEDNNSTEEQKDTEVSYSGDAYGTGFLPGKDKFKYIGAGVILFLILIFFGLVGSIGSVDKEDADNSNGDVGNPDKEYAAGTKYEKDITNSAFSTGGICTYDIKGATNGQTSVKFNQQVSDIKVRLMHSSFCDGTDNVPIEDESLIDFETYILGVVYAEVGGGMNEAEAKTQAVAARSFILDRAIRGGNRANGVKLENENGQWILQVRNCVADQVFCNPEQGCSKHGSRDNERLDVYSGLNNTVTYKDALPQNAKTRQWVAETAGQLLVTNNTGYIVGTNYDSEGTNAAGSQKAWRELGFLLDYKQILLKTYGSNKSIYTASCTGGSTSTGDYTSWKQYNAPWSNIRLGNSNATIETAGCLVTSISMLIAKSGVSANVVGDFNPGTFVEALSKNGGFDNRGNLQWNVVTTVAPDFKYQNRIDVSNQSRKDKLQTIQSLLNAGYYVVAEVKGNTGQHWVAIDSITGETINMFDPGSTSTNMWSQYNWKNTSRLAYFKV